MSGRVGFLKNVINRSMSGSPAAMLPFQAIPGPKPLPLIGNIWRYLPIIGDYKVDTLFENAQYNRKRYGPIVREQITPNHTILHLFDPLDIKSFIKQDSESPPSRRSHRALLKYRKEIRRDRYKDGGLFPENGPEWSRLRRLFQLRDVSSRTPILDRVAKSQIYDLCAGEEGAINRQFEQLIYRWALRTSLAAFLDYDVDEMISEETIDKLIGSLHDELDAIDGTELRSQKWQKAPEKCPHFQKLTKSESYLYEFIEKRLDHLISNEAFRDTSFLRKWLIDDKIDRKDVITFVIDMIFAGLHTTTYTTIFLLSNISESKHELQESLRTQIRENLNDGSITSETVEKLTVLRDCLDETLRLNPISIGTGRVTQKEITLRNFKVPEGIQVIAQTQASCRDPSIFEDPDLFRPDRWAKYRASPKEHTLVPLAFKPFGFGPRICIGLKLARLQITILVARLMQHYHIEFLDQIKTKTTMVHTLDGHVPVRVTKL